MKHIAVILLFAIATMGAYTPTDTVITVDVEDCDENFLNDAYVELIFENPAFAVGGLTIEDGIFVYDGPAGEYVSVGVNGLAYPKVAVEPVMDFYFEFCFVHLPVIAK